LGLLVLAVADVLLIIMVVGVVISAVAVLYGKPTVHIWDHIITVVPGILRMHLDVLADVLQHAQHADMHLK
jgi:hypothetical protein